MEFRWDVFQAIADPTRRQIIEMLAKDALNLNSIADNFNVSRQAVSVHVRILTECGLVIVKKQGRERFCEAKLEKLSEVATNTFIDAGALNEWWGPAESTNSVISLDFRPGGFGGTFDKLAVYLQK